MTGKAVVYETRIDKIVKQDKDLRILYALDRNAISIAQVSISPGGATPSGGASQGGTGNFLETQGDTMVGPIAFDQVLVTIVNGRIKIGETDRTTSTSPLDYSSYVAMTGAGTPDDLNWIDGAGYNGQLLFLQGTPSQIINIINANYPSISNITGTGTVTVTTAADHKLSTGQLINILQTTNFDVGEVTITVTSPTVFTYSDAGDSTPETSGQVQDGNIVSNNGTNVVLDGTLTPFLRAGVVLIFDQLQEAFGAWNVYSRPDVGGGGTSFIGFVADADLDMGTFNILAGGAGNGMLNIGHLDFVDNLATPAATFSIYTDGTDLFANTGSKVVNLDDIPQLALDETVTGLWTFDDIIRAGGAGFGMDTIGHLDFVDNLATPVAALSIYSDGTDLFANTGGGVVNLSNIVVVDPTQIIDGNTFAIVIDAVPTFSVTLNGVQKFAITDTRIDIESLEVFGVEKLWFDDSAGSPTMVTMGHNGVSFFDINILDDTEALNITFAGDDMARFADGRFQLFSGTPNTLSASMSMFRDDPSPGPDNALADIDFDGRDLGGGFTTYASILGAIEVATAGSERGRITFQVTENGILQNRFRINNDNLDAFVEIEMNTNDILTVGNMDFGSGSPTTGRIRLPNTAGAIKWESVGPTGNEAEINYDSDEELGFFINGISTGTFGYWINGSKIAEINNTELDMMSNNIEMGTGDIAGGGINKGMTNIGILTFINNTGTPGANGVLFFDGTDLKAKTGSTTVNLTDIGGSNFTDAVFRITDESDLTKKMAFDVGTNITTGTTRTYTVPNADGDLLTSPIQVEVDFNTFDLFNVDQLTFMSSAGSLDSFNVGLGATGSTGFRMNMLDLGAIEITKENVPFVTFDASTEEVRQEGSTDAVYRFTRKSGADQIGYLGKFNGFMQLNDDTKVNIAVALSNIVEFVSGSMNMIGSNFITTPQIGFSINGNIIDDDANGLRFTTPPTDDFTWTDGTTTFATLDVEGLFLNQLFIQFTSIASPGATGSSNVGELFMDSGNSNHLSIIRNGSPIDLEGGGGGNSISQLNSSVTVTDTGTNGLVTTVIDGTTIGLWDDVNGLEVRTPGILITSPADIRFGSTVRFIADDATDNGIAITHPTGEQFNLKWGGNLEYDFNETEFDVHGNDIRFASGGDIVWNIGTAPNQTRIHADGSNLKLSTGATGDEIVFEIFTTELVEININETRFINTDIEMDFNNDIRWSSTHPGGVPRIGATSAALLEFEVGSNDDFEFINGSLSSLFIREGEISMEHNLTAGGILEFFRNDSSPTDFDLLGIIQFTGNVIGPAELLYCDIIGDIIDQASASPKGALRFRVVSGGASIRTGFEISGQNDNSNGVELGFFGVSPVVQQVVAGGASVATVITALKNLGLFT